MKSSTVYVMAIHNPVAPKTQLALALGITKDELNAWMARPGFPEAHKSGGWRVEDCRQFIETQRLKLANG